MARQEEYSVSGMVASGESHVYLPRKRSKLPQTIGRANHFLLYSPSTIRYDKIGCLS